jgi:hypothetical protein
VKDLRTSSRLLRRKGSVPFASLASGFPRAPNPGTVRHGLIATLEALFRLNERIGQLPRPVEARIEQVSVALAEQLAQVGGERRNSASRASGSSSAGRR